LAGFRVVDIALLLPTVAHRTALRIPTYLPLINIYRDTYLSSL